jgi:hypothetical protein
VGLGVIRDKPINETKADIAGPLEKFDYFVQVITPTVKTLDA